MRARGDGRPDLQAPPLQRAPPRDIGVEVDEYRGGVIFRTTRAGAAPPQDHMTASGDGRPDPAAPSLQRAPPRDIGVEADAYRGGAIFRTVRAGAAPPQDHMSGQRETLQRHR